MLQTRAFLAKIKAWTAWWDCVDGGLLPKIKKDKYPAVTEEEEAISIPLQADRLLG